LTSGQVHAAVLFDLDGTLCEGAQSPETVYRGAFEAAGVEPFGEPDELWAALEGPPAVNDEAGYLAAGFTRVAAQHGRIPVDAEALASGFLETVDYAAVTPRAGAAAAVEAARRRAAVGLVTNGPESRQAGKLDALPFGDAFGTVVFAGDLRRRKPHPEPFERAVTDLGVDAEDTLFVGDSLEYDVAGAQNARLAAAWYSGDGDDDPEPYRPDHVLGSLAELGEVLGG
jgi:putative hydrolase of the HAD superfamily